jgi:soluble lytic murein transglycosylase-like protein
LKKPVYIFLAIFIALLYAPGASADIFKYVDDCGVIHFSNVPNNYSEKVVREKGCEPAKPRAAKSAKVFKQASSTGSTAKTNRVVNYTQPSSCEPLEGIPYADIINAKCSKYGVDPSLVKSIIKAESNFNPRALSNKGARGLMQLMPSTGADMGVRDFYDPEQNIDGGVRYFRFLLDNFGGDVELSVAAYNCGQGRVIRNGNCVPNIAETKNYVKKVMRISNNPVTGASFSRPIYRVELKDGSILFTESPDSGSGKLSLVD